VRPLARTSLLLGLVALTACSSSGSKHTNATPSTLLVAGALPTYGAENVPTQAMKAAIQARLRAGGGRVAGHRVGYVNYPTSSVNSGGQENQEQCSRTAASIAKDDRVVAVVGPFSPACARSLIPPLDQAGVAVVTPEITASGLTHEVPGWRHVGPCFLCAPGNLYPTGDRNFARVVATEDSEGRAAAVVLHRLGVRRTFVLTDGDQFDTVELAAGFLAQAPSEGIRVSRAVYSPGGAFDAVARRVAAAKADALYLLAPTYNKGTQVLAAIRRAGFRGRIVSSLTIVEATIATPSSPWESVLFTSPRLPLAAMPPSARRFAASIGATSSAVDAAYGGAAADVVVDAIRGSDGSRAGVRRALFAVRGTTLVGALSIDQNGDVHPQRVAVFRLRDRRFRYLSTVALG
jgi:branched-chain amino acid transport system substrate-binding protein